jgi:hypothetical protein
MITLKHTKNMRAGVEAIMRLVEAVEPSMEAYARNVEALKDVTMTKAEIERLCISASSSEKVAARMVEKIENGMGTYGRTAWDALNGIVEAIDYDRGGEANYARSLFAGVETKAKVCAQVMTLAGIAH